jgi:hypothetical protein
MASVSVPSSYNPSAQVLENNVFLNNTGYSSVLYCYSTASTYYRPNPIYLFNNRFSNPSMQYEVYVGTSYTSGTFVYAAYNYWGTTNESVIQARVYDFFDNSASTILFYLPFQLTTGGNSSLSSSISSPIRYSDCTISGSSLTSDLTIDSINCTSYKLLRNLYVPANVILTILPGVFIYAATSATILIDGTLIAR